MGKERAPREVKIGRSVSNWTNSRYGVGDRQTSQNKFAAEKPTQVLLDEIKMREEWFYNRFGVDEK